MAVKGWVVDKSATVHFSESSIRSQLSDLAGGLFVCRVGELEQLYSARSAGHYDQMKAGLHDTYDVVTAPADLLERALELQHDLAHYHGLWHRTPIADLFIAETALFHNLGVVHVDRDFSRIAEVRPLMARRLAT